MRLALSLGYQTPWTTPADHLALAQEAERLGFSCVWAAEAYGSDAPTMLAWIAGQTSRIDVGTAIMQIPARTPAMTAMTAATIDALSGGRFRLGVGVSGPQVSEGWHGVRFAKPLARTREYVEIVRAALARQTVTYDGEFYTLPLAGRAGQGTEDELPPASARTCRSTWPRSDPATSSWPARSPTACCWSSSRPSTRGSSSAALTAGRTRAEKSMDGFDVVPTVPVVVGDDVAMCAELVRWYAALYLGGMGSRERNFYNELATRMGFGDAAREVQDLYLAKRQRDAAAAVPLDFIDRTSLLGPVDRIADGMRAYAAAGVTTLSVGLFAGDVESAVATLRQVADAYERSGVGE